MAKDRKAEAHELARRADALGERIAAHDDEQLRHAWARVDSGLDAFRATSAALARAETKTAKLKLQARLNSQTDRLNAALAIVEEVACRLAGLR